MLLIGHEKVLDAARYRMSGIDDFDPKTLERAMAQEAASHQVEIGPIRGIEAERIVQAEEPTASLDERGHCALLLRGHPDEMLPGILFGPL
jgi:hypothetical protein